MNRLEEQDIKLRQALASGSQTSGHLQALLGVSQATLSRIVRRNINAVLALGAARSTEYALLETLGGLGSEIPVYEVDAQGDVSPFATLHVLAANEYGWQLKGKKPQRVDHLPYLLQNMRPEGFMGRAFAQSYAHQLGLPEKLQNWSDRQVLSALAQRGEDFVGNLIVGKESAQRYLRLARTRSIAAVARADRGRRFQDLANKAISGDLPGSSAGGEQPKFTALVESQQVIVKFASRNTDEGQRWSDLLVCEHLAAEVLGRAGFAAARTEIIQTKDWTFLQSDRFDRVGEWGRIPLLSLETVVGEQIGYSDTWADSAKQLQAERLISGDDAERLRWLSAFGTLIGNTDMHLGNVSLFLSEPRFKLAPVYDMSPMFYRPRAGGLLSLDVIEPDRMQIQANLEEVRSLAVRFWTTVQQDGRISQGFRLICRENIEAIEALGCGPKMRI